MKNNLLEIENLKKIYHTKNGEILALDDISFTIKDKEFVSIVGPSGCGKSTILTILAGILDKTDGKIKFSLKNPKIGYMLQEDSLFPWRTILDNACLGLEVKKELNDKTRKNVIELLEKYGLRDFIDNYPDSLSGGLKQRVG